VNGLYVHVPFCVSKCAYCDFYSLANRPDLVDPYVDAVLTEAQAHAGLSFETLYLGGGTPSLLGAASLRGLVEGLKRVFDLSPIVEATIEVNPESASEELLRSAMGLGFSRVSVGVQSLSDYELQGVGRVHAAAQAVEAVSRAVGMGFKDVSADVIVGLPGQTLGGASNPSNSKSQIAKIPNWGRGVEDGTSEAFAPTSPQGCAEGPEGSDSSRPYPFAEGLGVPPATCHCEPLSEHSEGKAKQSPLPEIAASSSAPRKDRVGEAWGLRGLKDDSGTVSPESLRCTLKGLSGLGVNHLSVYCLSLEQGTRLAADPPDDLPSDDEQAELFEEARLLLEEQGFIHYEISNFCLPGRECRHNLNYWRGGEYLGLGPAAASHLVDRRWKNRADLLAYIHSPSGVGDEVEELGLKEKAGEEAMLRLRLLVEGLAADEMVRRFGEDGTQELFSRLNGLVSQGLLTCDGSVYRLARSQVLVSNPIFSRVLG
jgi:coproporphyrinogen III oxidase-like Fe-S oxidoreductase